MSRSLLAICLLPMLLAACGESQAPRVAVPARAASPSTLPATEPIAMSDPLPATEDQWKKILSTEQYRVLREKGTERAFTGEYDHHFEKGTYACAACGQELFESDTKFNSGCGWPAFFAAKAGDRVTLIPDHSHGMTRTEVTCSRCGGHLGHVFDNERHEINGQEKVVSRYCINSVSLKFIPARRDAK